MLYYDSKYNSFSDFLRGKKNKHLVTDVTAPFELVERYKKVAAHVSGEAHKIDAKTILVTSVREHEGKSTVSANLALSLVKQSYKVLLIDGDMRRPTQNSIFLEPGEKLKATLGDLLMGKATMGEALRMDKARGLHLLLNNHNFVNSTDIVSSEYMTKLIDVVKKYYDFIVIDSPPMSLMADAEVFADICDMSILVVNYDMVLAQDLNDAIDSLRDCRAHFAGCILNMVRTLPGSRRVIGGYGGYGRYGNYGRYGKYGSYGRYGHYGESAN